MKYMEINSRVFNHGKRQYSLVLEFLVVWKEGELRVLKLSLRQSRRSNLHGLFLVVVEC